MSKHHHEHEHQNEEVNENTEKEAKVDGTSNKAEESKTNEAKAEEAKTEESKKVEATVEEKPSEDEAKSATKELAEMKNRYFRALADYQNLQRRASKEQFESYSRGVADIIKKLLPAIDTLDKAMEYLSKTQVDKKVADGLEMFSIQLTDILEKEGLKAVEPIGQKFDPNFHEAMITQNNPEKADDEVLVVYEKGYTFKDKVLRTAKVVVNKL